MRVVIQEVYHNATRKDGKPYVTKDGRAYEVCTLMTDQGRMSGFGSDITKSWVKGDEVEILVTEKEFNGRMFLNFKLTPKTLNREEFDSVVTRISSEFEALEKRVKALEGFKKQKQDHWAEEEPEQEPEF